ncbi:WD40 repeat-like protein [Phellopilus nigrolimitatus]|nr:WD40 repeat-like protein [Phellopilus nigrolimitatus]
MAPPAFTQTALFPCNPNTDRGVSTKLHISKDNKLVYANGKTVIIRDLKNASVAKAYSGHTRNVTVARFSPTGYYCASADITGTVRVWDTVGEDNILKGEYPAISGRINDLAWDGESKRIIAVGDGREAFGKAFMFDTGSSTGEIAGHTKVVNAVSIRHQRPFRAATASDDYTIVFHTGVPFKFEKTIKTHTRFVQDVKFSGTGDHFASVGSDSKIFLYDGKTGETIGEFGGAAHKGSIMAANWSPDSKTLVTSSMDGTVKLWDVERKETVQTWTVGTGVQNQQVGNAWGADGDIVSLSMSGIVNVFDQRKGEAPARFLVGPQKAITSTTLTSSGTFLAGTADGRILSYETASGDANLVSGSGHTSLVTSLGSAGDSVLSVGFDDTVARGQRRREKHDRRQQLSCRLSPSLWRSRVRGRQFVSEIGTIEAFRSNQRVAELSVGYQPNGIATTGKVVAVGGDDLKVHLYSWDGTALKESGTLDTRGTVMSLAFSPDEKLLVAGDSSGKITLFDVVEKKAVESRWAHHTSRITALAWTSAGTHIASGSLDTHVFVWSVAAPARNVAIRHAGPGGVNGVAWLEADAGAGKAKLASAGADGCVRVWEVKLP